MTVPDPDAAFDRAVAAGATVVWPVSDQYGWRLGRVVDPLASLGNRETARPRLLNSRPTSIWELVRLFTSKDSKMTLDSNHNLQYD